MVKKEGSPLTEEALIQFCKENLASYKKPKSIDFIRKSSPKTLMGKSFEKS